MTSESLLSCPDAITNIDLIAGDKGSESIIFGSGIPDPALYPRDQLATEIARLMASRSIDLGYSRGRGQPALREEIARHLMERAGGGSLTADDVVVTAGASGALQLTAAALLDPGDQIITEQLTYPAAVKIFRHLGATVTPATTDSQGIATDQVEELLRDARRRGRRVKAVYM